MLPIAVAPLYNCRVTQLPAVPFSTSPVTIACTGYPFVVNEAETIKVPAPLNPVLFAPKV